MRVIGEDTTYVGHEFFGLRGRRVRILAVMRRALEQGLNPLGTEALVTEDEVLARCGGVTRLDRIAVAFLLPDGTPSSVHWAARAVDLECLSGLAAPAPDISPDDAGPRR